VKNKDSPPFTTTRNPRSEILLIPFCPDLTISAFIIHPTLVFFYLGLGNGFAPLREYDVNPRTSFLFLESP